MDFHRSASKRSAARDWAIGFQSTVIDMMPFSAPTPPPPGHLVGADSEQARLRRWRSGESSRRSGGSRRRWWCDHFFGKGEDRDACVKEHRGQRVRVCRRIRPIPSPKRNRRIDPAVNCSSGVAIANNLGFSTLISATPRGKGPARLTARVDESRWTVPRNVSRLAQGTGRSGPPTGGTTARD